MSATPQAWQTVPTHRMDRAAILAAWDRLTVFAFLRPQEMNATRLRQEVIDLYAIAAVGLSAPGEVAHGGTR